VKYNWQFKRKSNSFNGIFVQNAITGVLLGSRRGCNGADKGTDIKNVQFLDVEIQV